MGDLSPMIVGLLAMLVLATVWLAIEAYRLRSGLEPVLNSSLARGISAF